MAAGADTDAKTQYGATALHVASHNGHLAVVEALLVAGADKDVKMPDSRTALWIASYSGHLAVVAALLAAGVLATLLAGDVAGGTVGVAAGVTLLLQ